jgi:hypothetical protein
MHGSAMQRRIGRIPSAMGNIKFDDRQPQNHLSDEYQVWH